MRKCDMVNWAMLASAATLVCVTMVARPQADGEGGPQRGQDLRLGPNR